MVEHDCAEDEAAENEDGDDGDRSSAEGGGPGIGGLDVDGGGEGCAGAIGHGAEVAAGLGLHGGGGGDVVAGGSAALAGLELVEDSAEAGVIAFAGEVEEA